MESSAIHVPYVNILRPEYYDIRFRLLEVSLNQHIIANAGVSICRNQKYDFVFHNGIPIGLTLLLRSNIGHLLKENKDKNFPSIIIWQLIVIKNRCFDDIRYNK